MSAIVLPTGLVIRTGVPHHGLSQFLLGPSFRPGPGYIILPDMTNCGVEARGFIFGPPIALALDEKFVPIRKPNKFQQVTCGSNGRKRSRPLDKDLSCSTSLLLIVDSEGDAQEEILVWVDARVEETWIEKLNLVIKELVKEKDEEKERFNGIIAGLLADKEKDKVDKDALLDRMSQIEAMLTATVRR
ncbi:putative adenine phosphoribosyltransferase [Helianthus annuus]|nr:putative adenine phosphoribosyltransferase [Helianthus annuus]